MFRRRKAGQKLHPKRKLFEKLIFVVLISFSLSSVLANFSPVKAARGMPGSPEFGIGAILYPEGLYVQDALSMAADLNLDWISVPISWARYQPDASAAPRLEALDPVMQFAAQHQIAVMVSISKAPTWAHSALGPEPASTAQFVLALMERYPQAIQAVELFPGANTREGWGEPSDSKAYYALFAQVNEKVRDLDNPPVLVAAGLQPLPPGPHAGDVNDLEFLAGLYQLGASKIMPVISVSYNNLTGDPLAILDGSEHRVFRHYEEVRQVMVTNQHQKGLIWITHLSLPSGKIRATDSAFVNINDQAGWMGQAYLQTRGQLYIGVTIGQSLNPEPEGAAEGVPSLRLLGAGGHHPFYPVLREMISLNKAGSATMKPGRPKEGSFVKKRP
jgi:hypothetical protein